MLVVKRLPWILLGIAIGVGATAAPRVTAQDPSTPIPITFIGVLEKDGSRTAIFSDGKDKPTYAKEGQVVLGQYKVIKIEDTSVTVSNLDGSGVQTIPMRRTQQFSRVSRAGAQERAAEDQVLTDHNAAGSTPWKFVSDSKTHSCWLAATTPNGHDVTALAPAPPEACR